MKKDNCNIADEVGNEVFLVNRRVVDGFTKPNTSLNQLMTEFWKMKSSEN